MENVRVLATLWVGLALLATLLTIWFRISTALTEIVVGTGVAQIKTGSASRGERVAKYNRLLEIEAELGSAAKYIGHEAYAKWVHEIVLT